MSIICHVRFLELKVLSLILLSYKTLRSERSMLWIRHSVQHISITHTELHLTMRNLLEFINEFPEYRVC